MIIEQIYASTIGYGKLTIQLKQAWLDHFDSWSPNVLRAHTKKREQSGGFLEIEWALGRRSRWRGSNLRHIFIQLTCQYCSESKLNFHDKI